LKTLLVSVTITAEQQIFRSNLFTGFTSSQPVLKNRKLSPYTFNSSSLLPGANKSKPASINCGLFNNLLLCELAAFLYFLCNSTSSSSTNNFKVV
jgi:hypothetical protein